MDVILLPVIRKKSKYKERIKNNLQKKVIIIINENNNNNV